MSAAIYVTVVVVATAGLVYELVAAAAASYLLGDSITQFSTVIGAYLFAMGIGSFLSRYVRRELWSQPLPLSGAGSRSVRAARMTPTPMSARFGWRSRTSGWTR